jgi:uncharacterized cupin superfamily protein
VARPNIYDAAFEYDDTDPPGYRSGIARIGKEADGEELAVKLFEVPAGEALCPYHYEYVEEWLIVIEGDLVVRVPDAEEQLHRGDVMRFASGPSGAHKLINRSDQAARVIMFSSSAEPAVAVYPDSDKIGVWTPNENDKLMVRRADGNIDYYDGER